MTATGRSRWARRRIFACGLALLAACFFAAAPAGPAMAQGKGEAKAKAAPQAAGPQAAPAWAVNCVSGKDGLDCQAQYTVLLKETQQRLLGIVVRVLPKEKASTMLLQLPLGLFLPAGTTLQIDKQPARTVEIQSCDRNGCYSGFPLTDADLGVLQKAQMLRVTFQNLQKQPINIDVALAGFAGAYAKIK